MANLPQLHACIRCFVWMQIIWKLSVSVTGEPVARRNHGQITA